MEVIAKNDYQKAIDEQKREVRSLVMEGLEQIKESNTKDFNKVCDRLEKKCIKQRNIKWEKSV